MRSSLYDVCMGHYVVGAADQVETPEDAGVPQAMLDAASAATVAETLQALATPSRLLILSRLRRGACAVTQLAEEIGMEQSAVSHQLRLLRHLGLVVGTRQGKSTVYALYDNHVAMLLDQAVYHSEHLRLGIRDQVATATVQQTAAAEAEVAPL
jgi:DNA-binding transcriptional ArsR family regulator